MGKQVWDYKINIRGKQTFTLDKKRIPMYKIRTYKEWDKLLIIHTLLIVHDVNKNYQIVLLY